MTGLTRRRLMQSGAAAVGLAATGVPGFSFADTGTLRATHFGGPYGALADLVAKPFAASGGGKVEYEVEQPAVILSKWQADPDKPLYDLGLMVPSVGLRAQSAGLVAPIAKADLPNLALAVPDALPSEGYGVHQLIDSVDLMYDKRQVTEPITSWLDLWRPELKGKIALPALPLAGVTMVTMVMVARALGGDGKSVDAALKKLAELKSSVRLFYTDPIQASQLIERGEIAVAPQYGARIGQLTRNNPHIVRATPKEGVPASGQTLCIAKNTSNKALALKYIDFVLSTPVQQAMAERFLIAPVNKEVKIAPEIQPLVMSDHAKLVWLDEAYLATQLRDWTERYKREVQG